ncbi:MAG: porin [Verrucomicrobiota bacterium]
MIFTQSLQPISKCQRTNIAVCVALTFSAFSLRPLPAQPATDQSASDRLERLERAVQQLEKRNAELEQEVGNLKKRSPFASELGSESRPKAASEGKAYLEKTTATEEKKPVYVLPGASEFKLTLGGFIQAQFEGGDISAFEGRFATDAAKDRFRLRRARINLSGDFAEQFDFKIEGDFEQSDTAVTVRDATGKTIASNSTRTSFGATDIFINWHQFPEFNIKLGQYKAPFGLEQITPDTKLFTIERSQPTSALTPERQVGVELWGKPLTNILPSQKELVTYWAGIFNGNGRNISVNDNNEFMYVGRLEVLALKAKLFNQDASVKFGGDALSSRDEAGTNFAPVGNIAVNSDGSLSSFNAPSAAERKAYSLDASLHLGPFDLIGEYLNERIRPRESTATAPAFAAFRADGYYVQGSYFIIPKTLQLVTKYESFNPGQVANDDVSSITGGVNYYVHGDDIKLLADYIHTWSDFRDANPQFGESEFDEILVRLQIIF